MTDNKQQFYEGAYAKETPGVKTRSPLGFLYRLLRKYEYYRGDAANDLLTDGRKILDIGCGNGEFIFKVKDKFTRLIGADIAGTRLKFAQNKLRNLPQKDRQKISFISFDADKTYPFPDNHFDAVVMIATLEHFYDPYQVMKEVRRITKKGGQLIIQVPNLGFLPHRISVLTGNLPVTSEDETGWDGGHLHYFTVNSLRRLFNESGFNCQTITCSGIFAHIRRFWVKLLGPDIIISGIKN